MIYHLQVHKNFIGWVISKLEAEGISSQRTRGYEPEKIQLFFRNAIVQESDELLGYLSNSSSKQDYQDATYKLRFDNRPLCYRCHCFPCHKFTYRFCSLNCDAR